MRTDRNRQAEALDDLDRLPDDQEDGTIGMLLITKACSSYPLSAGVVYCCSPVIIDALDTEGTSPTFTADAAVTLYAINIGSQVPAAGTYVIASAVGGRLVFSWNTPP